MVSPFFSGESQRLYNLPALQRRRRRPAAPKCLELRQVSGAFCNQLNPGQTGVAPLNSLTNIEPFMVAQNSILQRCFEEAASSSARALERCVDEAIAEPAG
jgi:hypothetical protein